MHAQACPALQAEQKVQDELENARSCGICSKLQGLHAREQCCMLATRVRKSCSVPLPRQQQHSQMVWVNQCLLEWTLDSTHV
jgi:hypothetical protein